LALEAWEPVWELAALALEVWEPVWELGLLIRTNFHHSRSTRSRSQRTTLSWHSCLCRSRSSTEAVQALA